MKHLASGYWKTMVSRGRGCIFQGFHCLQNVGKTTPEIVSKWHKKCLQIGSEGSQKCRWNMQGQLRKLDEKRSPKWGPEQLWFWWFLVLFWGLGPKVSQGGPRDTPRVPPGSKLLQNGSQNGWKNISKCCPKAFWKRFSKTCDLSMFPNSSWHFLVFSYSCRGRFSATFVQVKSRHSSTWLGGKTYGGCLPDDSQVSPQMPHGSQMPPPMPAAS